MRKGVIIMPKYRIIFKQQGFRAAGTLYEPGNAVEVSYMTATDTSYTFTVDSARFEQDYDPGIVSGFCRTTEKNTLASRLLL